MYNPAIHHRRSIRLKNYDYAAAGLYFITLCTQHRLNIFGKIKNGKLFLNQLGQIAAEEWASTPNIRENISLGEFIIMPNHMHGIIQINYKIHNQNTKINTPGGFHSPSNTIGAIIRGYKGATTKRINSIIRELRDSKSNLEESSSLEELTGELLFTAKEKILFPPKGKTGELQFDPNGENFAPHEKKLIPSEIKFTQNGEKFTQNGENSIISGDKLGELQFAPNMALPDISCLKGEGSIWQRNYYENIIRSEKAYHNISNYIINNPKNWKKDTLKQ